ncbi:HAD family hydrolase [Gallibacterium salpingitidis]|uniref:Phosphatase n=1 Tax=Gallibacterium salpingitidis TaxID=505341 RepID=A0A1A7P244_9PAST|nr:HAD family phosphatase [Gallibacterium salpingitidis]OBW95299.1 hypothetical protein QS62_04060 [Gallibacterium salpingitidis]
MDKKNKLAVFDLDGTLYDTTVVNFNSYVVAMQKYGFSPSIDYQYFKTFCNGRNYKVFLPEIIEKISIGDMERIHREKLNIYKQYLHYSKRNNHLFHILQSIKNEYITAIATTASRHNTLDILEKFGDIELFDFIITKEDVSNTKPDPECYILAMNIAAATPENTLIFEDSEVGLNAAKLSKASYIQIFGFN